jgi:hypothetical protein
MLDRLLSSALWITVMGLIMFTAGGSLLVGCRGLFGLFAGHYPAGVGMLCGGVLLGGTSYYLCRYCNDLIDR